MWSTTLDQWNWLLDGWSQNRYLEDVFTNGARFAECCLNNAIEI